MAKPALSVQSPCTMTVFLSQQSWIMVMFSFLSVLCTCVQVKKWHQKWSYSYWVGGFKHLMTLQSCEKVMGLSTTQCKMPMFQAHNFELAHLKKKKKNYKCIVHIHVVIGNFLVLYFRVLLVMKVLSCLYHPKAGLAGWAGWSTHYSPCCNFMCLLFHVVTL